MLFLQFKKFQNKDENYSLEIPTNWSLIGIREEYGHMFSDNERKQGMLTVRAVSALFSNLEKYSEDLISGMQSASGYALISKKSISVNKKEAMELVFRAVATMNGKKKNAAILTTVIHNPSSAQFFLLSYSVLEEEMNVLAEIYTHMRDSFELRS